MAESSDIIKARMKSGKLKSDPRPPKPKKPNIFRRIGEYYLDILKILLGVDADSLKEHRNKSNTPGPSYSSRPSIRDTYRVDPPPTSHAPNPYTYDPVAMDNMRIYLQGQDGRGDPPAPCDCDHDR